MVECSWNQDWGIDCLTCGFQRSFELLFRGEIIDSIMMFPATIPFLATIFITALHIWKKLKHGPKLIIGLYSFSAVLMVINYTIKLSNGSFLH